MPAETYDRHAAGREAITGLLKRGGNREERGGDEKLVARLEREQADHRNHNRRRSRPKPIVTKSQDDAGPTSARGYVSWRNGDPCRMCWTVPRHGQPPLSRRRC
jgi:hypothetical protein